MFILQVTQLCIYVQTIELKLHVFVFVSVCPTVILYHLYKLTTVVYDNSGL